MRAASRKAGFSAMVSLRALNSSGPSVGDLYQRGTKPQRIGPNLRRPSRLTTAATGWVGQTL